MGSRESARRFDRPLSSGEWWAMSARSACIVGEAAESKSNLQVTYDAEVAKRRRQQIEAFIEVFTCGWTMAALAVVINVRVGLSSPLLLPWLGWVAGSLTGPVILRRA